ncbi:MAG: zinc ribbon domain-containing protein [Actinomycetes bacterium]
MILIWGWRSLLKVLGIGEFHCPRCQADTEYRLVRPRRWFTMFFIPVVPLSWGEPYVECQRCNGAYREEILQAPTNKQFGYMLALGGRAMYAKAVAAGFAHSEHMIDRAVAQLRPLTGDGYNEANLVADVEAFGERDLGEFLGPLAGNMMLQGREQLISGLVSFVQSDGGVPPAVESVVEEAAGQLQLTAAHLAGIVATVSAASQNPEVP